MGGRSLKSGLSSSAHSEHSKRSEGLKAEQPIWKATLTPCHHDSSLLFLLLSSVHVATASCQKWPGMLLICCDTWWPFFTTVAVCRNYWARSFLILTCKRLATKDNALNECPVICQGVDIHLVVKPFPLLRPEAAFVLEWNCIKCFRWFLRD